MINNNNNNHNKEVSVSLSNNFLINCIFFDAVGRLLHLTIIVNTANNKR